MSDLPADVRGWIGQKRYEQQGEFDVERGYVFSTCASVENGNPLFWDEKAAREITGGWIAPPTMISVWFRPHFWAPSRSGAAQPLQVHFDLKEKLGLPEAIMTDNTIVFGEPVRPGDRLRTWQVLRSVSEPKTTKLGRGRFWVIDVEYQNQKGEWVGTETYTGFGYRRRAGEAGAAAPAEPARGEARPSEGRAAERRPAQARAGAMGGWTVRMLGEVKVGDALPELAYDVTATTVVLGALASRDWRPMHHDKDFAQQRNGVRDIFLNTPNQAAWFERFLTDWSGPYGRLGRMKFRMRDSVFPGDRMVFRGTIEKVETDAAGCGWVEIAVRLQVGDRTTTECQARIALPLREGDDPWRRRGADWKP